MVFVDGFISPRCKRGLVEGLVGEHQRGRKFGVGAPHSQNLFEHHQRQKSFKLVTFIFGDK